MRNFTIFMTSDISLRGRNRTRKGIYVGQFTRIGSDRAPLIFKITKLCTCVYSRVTDQCKWRIIYTDRIIVYKCLSTIAGHVSANVSVVSTAQSVELWRLRKVKWLVSVLCVR